MRASHLISRKVLKRSHKDAKITKTRKMSADLQFKPEEEDNNEDKTGSITEMATVIPDEVG